MKSLTSLIFGGALLAASSAHAQPASTVPDGFTVALGGDMIGPYHPLPGPEDAGFAKIAELFRKADLGFANQEGSILEIPSFPAWPAAENGGGYPQQPPAMARSMRAMGLALVSKSNNHATDYGTEGLVTTLGNLKDAGLAQGGAGMSLAEARAPGYVETPKGLAALVDTASTFPPMSEAGAPVDRRGQTTKPRPGISVLHVREVVLVPPAEIAHLRQLSGDTFSKPGEARIADQMFRASDKAGSVWEMKPQDETAILDGVKAARAKARFVLFSIHAHETAGHDDDKPTPQDFEPMVLHKANEAPSPEDPRPAAFEPVLFHAVIDAGADAVARTGPHVLMGIEIYKGRPIFYGLGSLFFDFGGRRSYTSPYGGVMTFSDEIFESVIPVVAYRGGKASVIRLYPTEIDASSPSTSGIPHPADAAHAKRILERLAAMSAPFGTKISIEDGVGVIRVP